VAHMTSYREGMNPTVVKYLKLLVENNHIQIEKLQHLSIQIRVQLHQMTWLLLIVLVM